MQTQAQNLDTNNQSKPAKRKPTTANGVDIDKLFATIGAVDQQRELAKFQFRASNQWKSGTHSISKMESYSGAGGVHEQTREFTYDADHHPVLAGGGNAPTPVEFLLHALAACLTAGIGNIASARGIKLTEVKSKIEGDIDLLGILGLSDEVRNGYQQLRISFEVKGDAPAEQLRALVEQSRARSAVYDVLTNGVPVEIAVNAG